MEYITTSEAAELKGCSERYIRMLIKDGRINAHTNTHAANNRKEYIIPVTELDDKLQKRYYKKMRMDAGIKVSKKSPSTTVKKQKTFDEYSQFEREEITLWLNIIKQWLSYRGSSENKLEADRIFIGKIKYDYPDIAVSEDILYRKLRSYRENDFGGLIDKRGGWNKGNSEIPKHILDAFLWFYLDERQLPISGCYRLTTEWVREFYPQDVPAISSERSFRRQAEKLPQAVIAYCRKGEKYLKDKHIPFIERLYEEIEANDVWIADNHTFDFFTTGENGKLHRLTLTAFTDAKSGVLVGFNLTDNPSSQSTLLALRYGILKYGLPKAIYVDNGSEFLTHDIGGRGHRKRANWNKDDNPPTILDMLGIEMHNALVKNAKAKPIERTFGTLKNYISRVIETFCGGTVLERPESLKYKLKKGIVPEDEQMRQVMETLINGLYNMDLYGGKEQRYKGMTRIDVWNESIQRVTFRKASEKDLALLLARTTRYQKIGRNGVFVTISNEKLWYTKEDLWKHQGKEVYVRFDPANIHSVRVYDKDDKYMFDCAIAKEYLVDFISENPEDVAAGEKARRHVEKRIKEYSKGLTADIPADKKIDFFVAALNEAEGNLSTFNIVQPSTFVPVVSDETIRENPALADVTTVTIDLELMNNNSFKRKNKAMY